jgi:putative flavoprotein involved in K+ transport
MTNKIDTIIIGAGQGGLATSYYLKKQGREHLILEQADQAGPAWRDGRWDSFTLVTPNWTFRLPGAEYSGAHRDGFLSRDEVVAIFAGYAEKFGLPLRTNTQVRSVEAGAGGGFIVRTSDAVHEACNVVVATGLFQAPKVPAFASRVPSGIMQLHSGSYRNPSQLPEGGVLVVGSSQSGCQIAQEIHQSGRPVTLCVSGAGRIPRRYRGKDIMEWAALLGISERTVDTLTSPKEKFAANPHMAGKSDGGSINLHQFARDGIRLVGRLQDVRDDKALLAQDLHDNLAKADRFEAGMLQNIDAYIARAGLDLPAEPMPQLKDGYALPSTSELDLAASGIRSIIWAIGYRFDFSMVKFPVFDADGYPVQERGVTRQPGLYFVGLPWLHKQKSGLLGGVGEDAAYIADHLCSSQLRAA